jgi:hypothetical protein
MRCGQSKICNLIVEIFYLISFRGLYIRLEKIPNGLLYFCGFLKTVRNWYYSCLLMNTIRKHRKPNKSIGTDVRFLTAT